MTGAEGFDAGEPLFVGDIIGTDQGAGALRRDIVEIKHKVLARLGAHAETSDMSHALAEHTFGTLEELKLLGVEEALILASDIDSRITERPLSITGLLDADYENQLAVTTDVDKQAELKRLIALSRATDRIVRLRFLMNLNVLLQDDRRDLSTHVKQATDAVTDADGVLPQVAVELFQEQLAELTDDADRL